MRKFLLLTSFSLVFSSFLFAQDYISINDQTALGSELFDNATHTAIDGDGNRLVYGTFSEEIDFDPGTGESLIEPLGSPDIFLASYTSGNELNWAFNLGRISLEDGMTTGGIALDADGNVLIAGSFALNVDFDPSGESNVMTSTMGKDGFVAKYGSDGSFLWSRQFGGEGNDLATAIKIDGDGDIILGVRFSEDIDVDPDAGEVIISPSGNSDAALVNLDSDAAYQWSLHLAPGAENEIITALAVNSSNDIALGATVDGISTGIPVQGMLAGVVNNDGTASWTYDFTNQGQSNMISHVAFSEDETHFYLGGRIQESTDFDPSGEEEILTPLFADPFVSKHAVADGTLAWAKYIESASTSDYTAGVLENNGIVYLMGSFDVSAVFVPGDFTTEVETAGASDVFAAVYDAASGDFIEAEIFGGAGSERANDTYFTESGDITLVGQFSSELELVNGESVASLGFEDAFTANFSFPFDLSAIAQLNEKDISLYPVPSSDIVYVDTGIEGTDKTAIKIINVVGQTVLEKEFDASTAKLKIDVTGLNQGVYLVEVKIGEASVTKRMIKQ